jgi:hypothetical protein
MAGRPRKPAKVLELSGAFRKNPQRRRARAGELSIATGLGPPPQEWLDKAASNQRFVDLLATWRQIEEQDVMRVLNVSHRFLVETTCYLMWKIRRANAGLGKATSGDFAQVKANLAAMGQTPADSSRVAEAVRMPYRGPVSEAKRPGSSWGQLVG